MANGATPADVRIDIGGWLQSAWEYFVEDLVPWLLIGVIVLAIMAVLSQIPIVGQIGLLVLIGPLVGGMFYAAFCRMRGMPVTVGMLFGPLQTDFVPLMIVGVVGGILQSLGVIACVVGVVVTFSLWMFGIPLVLERRLPFWDALELSRTTVQAQFGQWILFGLVVMLVIAAGGLLMGIGVIATYPFGILLIAVAYRETFGLENAAPAAGDAPAPPAADAPTS